MDKRIKYCIETGRGIDCLNEFCHVGIALNSEYKVDVAIRTRSKFFASRFGYDWEYLFNKRFIEKVVYNLL